MKHDSIHMISVFRHGVRFALLCVVLLCGMPLHAQTRIWSPQMDGHNRYHKAKSLSSSGLRTDQYEGVHHLVGLSLSGGYSAFLTKAPVLSNAPGGYGLGLDFHYAYQNGRLLVQTGLGATWQDVANRSENQQLVRERIQDSEGVEFRLQYDFTDRVEHSRNLYLQIPLMMGTYFWDAYFLVGPKLNLQLAGATSVNTLATTTASYQRYIGIFEQMDNHGMRQEVPLEVKHEKLGLKVDLMISAEIGYEWALSNKGKRGYRKSNAVDNRLRLAAYCDFGVLDIAPSTDIPSYMVPDQTRYDFATFDFHHRLMNAEANSFSVHNIFAGVRFTYFFFGHQSAEKCLLCGSRGAQKNW